MDIGKIVNMKEVKEIILKLNNGILLTIKMPIDVNSVDGKSIVATQEAQKKTSREKETCPYCSNLYGKYHLSKHMLNCKSKPQVEQKNPLEI